MALAVFMNEVRLWQFLGQTTSRTGIVIFAVVTLSLKI